MRAERVSGGGSSRALVAMVGRLAFTFIAMARLLTAGGSVGIDDQI